MALTSWATHVLQWQRQWAAIVLNWRKSQKLCLSSDCSLQLENMKEESLVIAYQHDAVNVYSCLVHTARHIMGAVCTRSRFVNRKETGAEGMDSDWDEVVTR